MLCESISCNACIPLSHPLDTSSSERSNYTENIEVAMHTVYICSKVGEGWSPQNIQ